ncbi:MAG: hypothetical protein ACO1RX_11290 [Candidatus Sericytochromatia bacterium]
MKVLILLLVLVALAGGAYFATQGSPLGQAPLGTLMSGETQQLVKLARDFMEDLKYKNFKDAGTYSLPEQQGKYDMPKLIERLFAIKPEFLDIQNYEVTSTDVDSSGERARVHLKTEAKVLNTDELRKPEVILYYARRNGQWYMDLASSLQ